MQANQKSGFTLVEIMVVVVIIGLLAAIAIPAFSRAREASQNARLASDLRLYAGAIETFIMENGVYPEDSSSGAVPAGLEPYIHSSQWSEGPSIGGLWDVEQNSFGVTSAVGVHRFTASVQQLANFDRKYDDGDLTGGNFRRIATDRYYYVIAE
ncbi:MAG TPA: prepilin-type N-terminal cleavage/methylation domain-containing protein [Opitutales bacterium]|nr:prepilin-type N-terminal cleavage/methylation domain-containing protein [Opitutales bacterium]